MNKNSYNLEGVNSDSISDLKFWLIDNNILFNYNKDNKKIELFDVNELHEYKLKILYQKLNYMNAKRVINEDFGGGVNAATYGNTPGMGSVEPATASSPGSGDIFTARAEDEFETFKNFKKKKKKKVKNAK